LIESKSEPIGILRNAVEHIDELILKDELPPNKPLMLAITKNSDGITISHYEIKFTDLSILLKNMHEIGEYILSCNQSDIPY